MADITTQETSEEVKTSDFVHLHVHSDYSLLDGASKLGTLVSRAKELGFTALALTDHGNMFGILNFYNICRNNGIKPIIGCEIYMAAGKREDKEGTPEGSKYYHLILLAKNDVGYQNLSWIISKANTEGYYYKPRADRELLEQHSEGLICLSACLAGELPQKLLAGKDKEAEEVIQWYQKTFGKENYFIEFQDHNLDDDKRLIPKLLDIAKRMEVPMVVTNDVHYAYQDDAKAQDVLICIGTKKLLSDTDRMKFENDQFYLKSEEEMASLFPDYPEMISNTKKIADMCNCEIKQYKTQELKDCLPVYQIPPEFNSQDDYVRHIVYTGLEKRYKEITPEIKERAEYELGIIFSMGFSGYFLIVWDFINWAKNNDVPIGPGRGSGAGSLVAYAMTITDIDPFRYKLIFERFLNPERISMPDFDVDMCFEGRQRVIQYTREKYGDPQVGHIVTFGTLKAKAVIADVGRVLNIPLADVNMLKKCIPDNPKAKLKDAFTPPDEKHPDNGQLIPFREDPRYKELFDLCIKLENVNRQTGLHASGIVIGRSELPDWAPIHKDGKTGKVAVQYTMDIIEPCGLVKMDYLGLKTLTLIKYAERIIRKRPGLENFTTDNVPDDDEKTFDMLCKGESVAIFQFESPGMQKIMKQLQPRCIEELVALNALYRPGPMDYIPQYIEGKWHPETVRYPDPCLEDILKETYGVMVYQEQVMQVAQRIAGYSLGGADMLRRAMGKKKKEVMDAEKVNFVNGAVKNGFDAKHAENIFDIMVPFAGYGFNKSHAAAYSVVAYKTAYLKANYPAEFIAANLTNEITSVDKLPVYIAEGRRMGLEIDPPDINRSDKVFDVVDGRIVYGLLGIKNLGESAADEIIRERQKNGPFKSYMEFLDRIDLRSVNRKAMEVLIKTGCFDKIEPNRNRLLINFEAAIEYAESKKESTRYGQASLFDDTDIQEFVEFKYQEVEDWPQIEKLRIEKELIGFYISGHPLDSYKKVMERCTTMNSAKMANALPDTDYTIAVLITEVRKIITKKGTAMGIVTGKDYEGEVKLTFFSKQWERLENFIQADKVLAFKGRVDHSEQYGDSFQVDELLDINNLQEQSVKSIHIKLFPTQNKRSSIELRDFLVAHSGNCSVYLHIERDGKNYTIQTNNSLKVSSSDDFILELSNIPSVDEVWKD